jgi:hypothetical protein
LFPGTLWATPGGDHAATASATATVNSVINDPTSWSSAGLVSDVQAWLNTPSSNFGWELINLDETTASDFRAFYTREFSDATLRPQLQITFEAPATAPEPTSMLLLSLGMFGLVVGARGRKPAARLKRHHIRERANLRGDYAGRPGECLSKLGCGLPFCVKRSQDTVLVKPYK